MVLVFSKRHVIAIEIDAKKVGFAVNNAKVYGVEDYIDFVIGDFFQLAPRLKVNFLLSWETNLHINKSYFLYLFVCVFSWYLSFKVHLRIHTAYLMYDDNIIAYFSFIVLINKTMAS